MKIRNAIYNEYAQIDCEVEHPLYGWIPFTADKNDVEENGRNIFKEAEKIAEEYTQSEEEQQAEFDGLKALKKAEINIAKTKEEYSNIPYLGYQIQADADSQAKMTSAVLLCQAAGLQKYSWWTADNKQVDFTTAELVGLGLAIAQRSAGLVAKGRTLKDRISAAKTAEELNSIKWE